MLCAIVIEHLYSATQSFSGSPDTSRQDSLQAFLKKGKRKGEELKAQLLRMIIV